MEYCRVCAKKKANCVQILGDEGCRRFLADKMRTCLNILVCREDKLPLTLCPDCGRKLSEFSQFRDMGRHAQLWMQMCLVTTQDRQYDNAAADDDDDDDRHVDLYTCDSCRATFSDKAVLRRHVTTRCYRL